jgi:hypothetical protein
MSTPAPRPVEGQQAPTRRSSEGDAGITEHGDTKIHIGNMLPDDGNRPERELRHVHAHQTDLAQLT